MMPSAKSPSRVTSLLVRVFRLPFDLLFLTFDFLRYTLWLVLQSPRLVRGRRAHPYRPCVRPGFLPVAGQKVWVCAIAAKYGNPFLLRLLFPSIRPVSGSGRPPVWAWQKRGSRRPSTILRYLGVGLLLALLWGSAGMLVAVGAGRSTRLSASLRQIARRWAPGASEQSGKVWTTRDPELARQLCAEADKLLAGKSWQDARRKYREALASDAQNLEAQFGNGLTALELGLTEDARNSFAAVLARAPNHRETLLANARLLASTGADAEAVQALQSILATEPDNLPAQSVLAECYRHLGQTDLALKTAQAALAKASQDRDLVLTIARAYLQLENVAQAEAFFRKAVELDPAQADARVELAGLLRRQGKDADCEASLAAILRDFPDQPDAVLLLVDLQAARGDTAKAIELCKGVTDGHPDYHSLRQRYGALLLGAGRYDEAYLAASALLQDVPGNRAAHLQLATIFLQRGLPSLAVEHCKKVLAQGFNDREAHRMLAAACMAKGDMSQAIAEYALLLQAFPDDLEFLLGLAECQGRSGDHAKAMETLQGACTTHPQAVVPVTELAKQQFLGGKRDEAMAGFRRAYDLAPQDWSTQNNLAVVLAFEGKDLGKAFDLAQKAFQQVPTQPQVADTLGWIHLLRGENQMAAPYLAFAFGLRPNIPQVAYHYAEFKARTGDPATALRLARRVLEIGPDSADAEGVRNLVQRLEAAAGAPPK